MKKGPVAVPVEEFDVVMIDGQVVLMGEENPRFIIPRWPRDFELGSDFIRPPTPDGHCPFTDHRDWIA